MTESSTVKQTIGYGAGPAEAHKHLLANRLVQSDGFGPAIELGSLSGRLMVLHLEIDHVVQHKALCVSVWGSTDGTEWGDVPLLSLPPKHYCGNYLVALDLSEHPEVRYLRVGWKTTSWERSGTTLFGFSVVLEPSSFRLGGVRGAVAGSTTH